MPLIDQLSRPVPDRHSPTIHVKKYRKVRVTPSRTSPVRSVSTPATQYHSSAPEKARDKTTITRYSLPIDSAIVSSFAQGMANHPAHGDHSQPMSEQISTFSSRSNSRNCQWSGSNSLSSADYSMMGVPGLVTPGPRFSDSDSSFHDLHFAESDPTSSLNSEVSTFGTDKFRSIPNASSIPHSPHRPTLWVDTTIGGEASELCYSPIESDPPIESDLNDGSPYPRADDTILGHHDRVELGVYDAPHTCGGKETFPDYLNDCDVSNTCGMASASSSEDGPYKQVPPRWCECHWLLNRPTLASLEPREILKICDSYSQQMRDTRQTLLRRLQDMFETLWQKIRNVVPSLQEQVRRTLILILDTPPTLQDGLITLSLLSDEQPLPSLQGYISLAFFAKAWLSLEGQHVTSDVTNSLFLEMSRCVAAEASPAEQEAYEYVLQLLWQPVNAPESQQLFCPTPTQTNVCAIKCNSGTNTTSRAPPKGILSHVCCDIVDGETDIPSWNM